MSMALASNASYLVDACMKTNVTIYQVFMLTILGDVSLNPCTGRSASDQILTWVGMQLSTHLLKINITVSMYSKDFGLKHFFIIIKMFCYKVTEYYKFNVYLMTVTPLRVWLPVYPKGVYNFWGVWQTHNEWKGVVYTSMSVHKMLYGKWVIIKLPT